jgi:hypothetical protein
VSDRPLLPPRLKDWTEGKYQIGVFVRTRTGGTVQGSFPDASDLDVKLLMAVVVGNANKLSPRLQAEIVAELEAMKTP